MDIELEEINVEDIPKEVLDKMEFEKWKWVCKYKGCNHYTHVRDYGAFPMVQYKGKWINIREVYLLCGKHWKLRKQADLPLKGAFVIVDEVEKIIR